MEERRVERGKRLGQLRRWIFILYCVRFLWREEEGFGRVVVWQRGRGGYQRDARLVSGNMRSNMI